MVEGPLRVEEAALSRVRLRSRRMSIDDDKRACCPMKEANDFSWASRSVRAVNSSSCQLVMALAVVQLDLVNKVFFLRSERRV